MHVEDSLLPILWREAADDLGLEIVAPFELVLGSGACLRVPLLLRHFGAAKGMLILSNYNIIENWTDGITQAGFGYSTMSEPDLEEAYVREEFIEVLMDWGWSGAETEKPVWLCDDKPKGTDGHP